MHSGSRRSRGRYEKRPWTRSSRWDGVNGGQESDTAGRASATGTALRDAGNDSRICAGKIGGKRGRGADQARPCRYCVVLAKEGSALGTDVERSERLDRFEMEHDNFRAALELFEHGNQLFTIDEFDCWTPSRTASLRESVSVGRACPVEDVTISLGKACRFNGTQNRTCSSGTSFLQSPQESPSSYM